MLCNQTGDMKRAEVLFFWGSELEQTNIVNARMATKKYPELFLLWKLFNICGLLKHYISIHVTFYLIRPLFCLESYHVDNIAQYFGA